ncbi:class I SAM-dependent methyltransferase [Altererythrobacter sp. H2]|uniref:class I SAM-dependent methyltransferase n=1 Tax=Altererythrobacter sp. H2 TaxID=3108391 RepID=UPI002B4BC562|nr:class I SAM-dependent methyltransferase [Altererythrobacter sp. H2]WRK97067.1 class I SAM-dependent methyltransferase [Altererythrobacter sp. H2]
MTDKNEWQGRVGQNWAAEWRRTDRSFTGLTDVLLNRASARPFRRALDVGCGAGELSLALARGHAGAEVVGLDISPDLIAVARERSGYLGNVFFDEGDASHWQLPGYAPDLIASRHGVMFFDRPVAAFAHLLAMAAPGARLVYSCFRDVSENPWADRVISLLPPEAVVPIDPLTPGPFAMADPVQVEGILAEAGWQEIRLEPVDFAFILGGGENPLEDAVSYMLTIGPAARAARMLPDEDRANFIGRLRRFLANNVEGGLIALRAGAWIVSAQKAL